MEAAPRDHDSTLQVTTALSNSNSSHASSSVHVPVQEAYPEGTGTTGLPPYYHEQLSRRERLDSLVKTTMRHYRRVTPIQQIGLVLFVVGIVAMVFAYPSACPNHMFRCEETKSNAVFIVGLVFVLLFLCCPCFALGEARAFYDYFPALKGRMDRRRKKGASNSNRGTATARAASFQV